MDLIPPLLSLSQSIGRFSKTRRSLISGRLYLRLFKSFIKNQTASFHLPPRRSQPTHLSKTAVTPFSIDAQTRDTDVVEDGGRQGTRINPQHPRYHSIQPNHKHLLTHSLTYAPAQTSTPLTPRPPAPTTRTEIAAPRQLRTLYSSPPRSNEGQQTSGVSNGQEPALRTYATGSVR